MPRSAAPASRAAAVRPVSTRSLGNVGFTMLCIALLVAGLMSVLLLNTARAQQSYTLGSLQRQNSQYTGDIEELNTDIDALSAPQQIAQAAQKLGMGPATKVRYVEKSTGKVLGASSAAKASAPFTVETLPTTPASLVAGSAVAAAQGSIIVSKPKPKAPAATTPSASSSPSAAVTGPPTAPASPSASAKTSPAAKATKPATATSTKPTSSAKPTTPTAQSTGHSNPTR